MQATKVLVWFKVSFKTMAF